MRKLLEVVRSSLRLRTDDTSNTGSSTDPRYGESVSYGPCPNCREGSLVYDEKRETTVCNVCGPDET